MARTPRNGLIKRVRARRARAVAEEIDREDRLRERISHQIASQWESVRESRRVEEPTIASGPSNLSRAQVPWALDLAAGWAWRFVIIVVAALMLLWTLRFFAIVVLPLIVALFIAALVAPVVAWLVRARIPRQLASLLVVVGGILGVSLMLTFVGQQVSQGLGDLKVKVVEGLEEVRDWLQTGPLEITDKQIDDGIDQTQDFVTSRGETWVSTVTDFGVALSHVAAGFFIVLFATYFFLADGRLIWAWIVRLFPRAARQQADTSGVVAWRSLTQFVRATVLVAAVDAIGIMIVAALLKVPLIGALGVLVFLGAFVPLIGAFLSGSIAVLVALVAHGPVVALLMFAGVVLVQQIEAHVLQPFLMGRFVSVHPLGVIVAIAAGIIVAGIAGALIAVPLAAALNAVVQHLASDTLVGEGPEPPPDDVPAEAVADSGDPQ